MSDEREKLDSGEAEKVADKVGEWKIADQDDDFEGHALDLGTTDVGSVDPGVVDVERLNDEDSIDVGRVL